MVTETQQAVFDEIAKYTDIEAAREHAKEIAEKVDKLDHIRIYKILNIIHISC